MPREMRLLGAASLRIDVTCRQDRCRYEKEPLQNLSSIKRRVIRGVFNRAREATFGLRLLPLADWLDISQAWLKSGEAWAVVCASSHG